MKFYQNHFTSEIYWHFILIPKAYNNVLDKTYVYCETLFHFETNRSQFYKQLNGIYFYNNGLTILIGVFR